MDASCGLSPSACSLGMRSEFISELMDEVDGIDESVSIGCINRGCYKNRLKLVHNTTLIGIDELTFKIKFLASILLFIADCPLAFNCR